MQHIFPRALVACMVEGREPHIEELEFVTAKVWHDVYSSLGPSLSVPAVDHANYLRAAAIARASLGLAGAA
jgi:hypothetical protein